MRAFTTAATMQKTTSRKVLPTYIDRITQRAAPTVTYARNPLIVTL
jgi:hypothetical protein